MPRLVQLRAIATVTEGEAIECSGKMYGVASRRQSAPCYNEGTIGQVVMDFRTALPWPRSVYDNNLPTAPGTRGRAGVVGAASLSKAKAAVKRMFADIDAFHVPVDGDATYDRRALPR